MIYRPVKYFCFDLPNKNQFIFQEILIFVWPIKGGKSKQKYFTRVNQKNNFTEGIPEMTYITGDKDLLTLSFIALGLCRK